MDTRWFGPLPQSTRCERGVLPKVGRGDKLDLENFDVIGGEAAIMVGAFAIDGEYNIGHELLISLKLLRREGLNFGFAGQPPWVRYVGEAFGDWQLDSDQDQWFAPISYFGIRGRIPACSLRDFLIISMGFLLGI